MDFLSQHFIVPILRNGWFNPFNTAVYGLGLLIGFILVFKFLKRMKIPVNGSFFAAILPFIFWASSTRAFRDFIYKKVAADASAYPGFFTDINYHFSVISQEAYTHIYDIIHIPSLAWFYSWIISLFPTPGSYLITFLFALVSLLIGILIERKTGILYWKVMAFIGIVLCAFNLLTIPFNFITPLTFFLPIISAWVLLFFGLSRLLRTGYLAKLTNKNNFLKNLKSLFTYQNTSIISAHMFDATATFVALSFFGFGEQHPVPRLFIGAIGPGAMFLLKIAVLIPILWLIDRETEDRDFRNFLKIGILILGLAPGLRDLLTLLIA
jgi:uncharacterized membrane protein